MKYNFFNEPMPRGAAEIEEALVYCDFVVHSAIAEISFNDEIDSEFHGFVAEISEPGRDAYFSTLGYESKEQLIADLRSVHIRSIKEY